MRTSSGFYAIDGLCIGYLYNGDTPVFLTADSGKMWPPSNTFEGALDFAAALNALTKKFIDCSVRVVEYRPRPDWFHPDDRLLIGAAMGKTKQTNRSELLPGTLDMLVLKTLSRDVMHGYGIAKHIQQMSDDALRIEEGSLYPALQRMELKGWISSEWSQSPTNRRARYYRLTAKGRKRLFQEVSSFDRFLEAISRVMRPA